MNTHPWLFATLIVLSAHVVGITRPLSAAEPVSGYGFTVALPEGRDWRPMKGVELQVVFIRPGTSAYESIGAAVTPFSLEKTASEEDFRTVIVEGMKKDLDPARFDVIASTGDLSADCGPYCYAYDVAVLDKAPLKKPIGSNGLYLRRRGYYKRHPDNPAVGILADYSTRTERPASNAAFEREADAFIAGVQLTPIKE